MYRSVGSLGRPVSEIEADALRSPNDSGCWAGRVREGQKRSDSRRRDLLRKVGVGRWSARERPSAAAAGLPSAQADKRDPNDEKR